MPTGTEVGVAYVSVVPSAQNFAGKLRGQISPANLGKEIGAELSKGIESSLKLDPVSVRLQGIAKTSGTNVGTTVGSSMSKAMGDHIDTGVRRGLDSLKRLSIGFAGVAGGAFVLGKQFFDAASDLNESASKTQVVFGDAFGAIDQMAQNSAKSMGMSRQAALEAAATFGNLFRSMGMGTDVSAQMSTSLLQLAGDLASFNNVDPTEALDALRSGLVGETEPLRRFGVNINEARIQAEALRLGLVKSAVNSADVEQATVGLEKAQLAASKAMKEHGENSIEYRDAAANVASAQAKLDKVMAGSKVDLDAAQKAQATYSLIMKDTSLAQGDFARTSEGAANKQRILTATWEDTKARLGVALMPLGITVLDQITGLLNNLSTWWATNGGTVMGWFDTLKTKFYEIFGPDPVASFQNGVNIIRGWWDQLFGAGSPAAATAPTTLDNIRTKMDEIFGPDKVANFQAGADIIATKMDEIFGPDKMASFQNGLTLLREKWDYLYGSFEAGAMKVSTVTTPVFEFLGKTVLWLKDEVFDPLFGFIKDSLLPFGIDQLISQVKIAVDNINSMITITSDFIKNVLDPIVGIIQTMWDKIQQARDNPVISAMLRAGGVPGFALGGVVPGTGPQAAVVHGGETVLATQHPQYAGIRGISAATVAALAAPVATRPTLAIERLEVSGQNDPNATAWAIRRELRRAAYFAGAW